MNKALQLLMAAVIMTGFAACSSDEDLPTKNYADTPMSLSAGITMPSTRAGYDSDTDLQSSDFGLFVSTAGSTQGEVNYDKYNATNMKCSYTGGAWGTAEQLLWKGNSNQVTYYAYMPYNADSNMNPESYSFDVKENQTAAEDIKASDFLLSTKKTVTAAAEGVNGTLPIAFDHVLSKLTVKLTKGTELADDVTFTTVTIKKCALSATINLSTKAITTDNNTTGDILMHSVAANEEYQAIIMPQTFAQTDSNPLTIEIYSSDGKTYLFVADKKLTFVSGYNYTLPITVGRDKVVPSGIQANPWSNATEDGSASGSLETE